MANVIRIKPFYFTDDDDRVPLCPGCYELKGAMIHLIPTSQEIHTCPVCRFEYHYTDEIYNDYVREKNRKFFEEKDSELQ